MNSIDPKCNKKKWAYDNCFNNWFREKYLVEGKEFKEGYVPCEELHSTYQACILKAIEEQELDVSGTKKSILEVRNSDIAEAAQKRDEECKS